MQEAFAGAARNRFCFRSEEAAVDFVRARIAEHVNAGHAPDDASAAILEWPDVLRRASIETGRPVEVAATGVPRTRTRRLGWRPRRKPGSEPV